MSDLLSLSSHPLPTSSVVHSHWSRWFIVLFVSLMPYRTSSLHPKPPTRGFLLASCWFFMAKKCWRSNTMNHLDQWEQNIVGPGPMGVEKTGECLEISLFSIFHTQCQPAADKEMRVRRTNQAGQSDVMRHWGDWWDKWRSGEVRRLS